jgi:ankyrin repeat protein
VLLPPRPSQNGKYTPLMFAAANGHPSTVQKLLAAGADPTLKDKVRAASAVAREGAVVGAAGIWGAWGGARP